MTTAGEAASLFGGSPDLANDPFATSLGNDSAPAELPSGSDLFSGQDDSSAADLFASTGEADLFSAPAAASETGFGTYNANTTDYGDPYHAYGGQSSGAPAAEQYAPQTQTHYGTSNGYGHQQYGSVDAYGQQQYEQPQEVAGAQNILYL